MARLSAGRYPDFKAGDKFRMLGESNTYPKGSILELKRNDGSSCPYFWNQDKTDYHVVSWSKLEPVTDQPAKQRRAYMLIKDAPTIRKGAVYQEQCDDGTQPYELLDLAYSKVNHSHVIKDRKLIEQQPKWFTEVFKVTPEYMTAEELERWNAFKGTKPTKAATAAPAKGGTANSAYWTPERKAAQSRKIKAYWRKKHLAGK